MSFVKRITVVDVNKPRGAGASNVAVATVFKERRRKVSKGLRSYERADRRVLKAVSVFVDNLRERNDRSTYKRRDGWMTDRSLNIWKAEKKAWKILRSGWN